MKLDISSLKKAFDQLVESLDYLNSEMAINDKGLRNQFRNSAIQCFECTYESAYKMLYKQLLKIVKNPGELKQLTFADFIRTAAEAGLVLDVKRFLNYRIARNLTDHTYDEKKAEQVIAILKEFKNDIAYIIAELNKRN